MTKQKIITLVSFITIVVVAMIVGIYLYQIDYNPAYLIDKQSITCPDGTQHIVITGQENTWCEINGHTIATFDLNTLPILQDCRKTADKEDFKDEAPVQEKIEQISKTARILAEFIRKPGYTVGRIRQEVYGVPNGYYCLSWFNVAFKKTQLDFIKHPILSPRKPEDINQAFAFSENDLENVGWLLFGDIKTNQEIQERYNRVKETPLCSNSASHDCLSSPLKPLPPFSDGAIKVGADGRAQLHRYSTEGKSKYSFNHYTLSITLQGRLDIQTEEIFSVDTGILF